MYKVYMMVKVNLMSGFMQILHVLVVNGIVSEVVITFVAFKLENEFADNKTLNLGFCP